MNEILDIDIGNWWVHGKEIGSNVIFKKETQIRKILIQSGKR